MATIFDIQIKNSPASIAPDEGDQSSEVIPGDGSVAWTENQVFVAGSSAEAVVKINYPVDLFSKLTVNGQELQPTKDYFVDEGSTIITLPKEYLSSLPVGSYDLAVFYLNDTTVHTTFVAAQSQENAQEVIDSGTVTPNTGFLSHPTDHAVDSISFLPFTLFGLSILFIILIINFIKKHHSNSPLPQSHPEIKEKSGSHPFSKLLAHKKIIPVALSSAFGLFVLAFALSSLGIFSKPQINANADGQDSLELYLTTENISETVDLSRTKTLFVEQDAIVKTATPNGYKLYVSSLAPTDPTLYLNGDPESDHFISPADGTLENPAPLDSDSYGFMAISPTQQEELSTSLGDLSQLTEEELAVKLADLSFSAVPADAQNHLLRSQTAATAANDKTIIIYGFNLSDGLPNGAYQTNNQLVYTAIANPDAPRTVSYSCAAGTGEPDTTEISPSTATYLNLGQDCEQEGYEPVKWNSAADGSGQEYLTDVRYTSAENLNLYAIYDEPMQTISLRYELNGGESNPEDPVPDQETQELRAPAATFTVTSAVPVKTGATFLGWSLDKEAEEADFIAGDQISVSNNLDALYAIWQTNTNSADDDLQPVGTIQNAPTFQGPAPPDSLVDDTASYIITYDCNQGTGTATQKKRRPEIELLNGSFCSRSGYTVGRWNTAPDGSGTTYPLGGYFSINADTTLYAIWIRPWRNFLVGFNANGGASAPTGLIQSAQASSYIFTLPTETPTRDGYDFLGWTTNPDGTGKVYSPGHNFKSSKFEVMLYAKWGEHLEPSQGPVLVENIALAASAHTILLNSENKTIHLRATVSPSYADNPAVAYRTSNSSVATVSQNGVIVARNPGVATITVIAQDESHVRATFKVTVRKKVAIVTGPSYLYRIAGERFANVQDYTDSVSNNYYSLRDKSLFFAYKSGTGFDYQVLGVNGSEGEGWKSIRQFINTNYKNTKNYVDFYIYFMVTSNDTRVYSCTTLKDETTSGLVYKWVRDYDNSIKSLTNQGYAVHGIIISPPPLRPDQSTGKIVVHNTDANRCEPKKRSNYKYHMVSNAFKHVSENFYPGLTYLTVFKDIVDYENTKIDYPFKPGWEDYSTSDGVHFLPATAKKYFKYTLQKSGVL